MTYLLTFDKCSLIGLPDKLRRYLVVLSLRHNLMLFLNQKRSVVRLPRCACAAQAVDTVACTPVFLAAKVSKDALLDYLSFSEKIGAWFP